MLQNESSQIQNKTNRRSESSLRKRCKHDRPDLDKTIRSSNDVARFAREFLQLHKQSEEYLYMICMNTKNEIISIFLALGKDLTL